MKKYLRNGVAMFAWVGVFPVIWFYSQVQNQIVRDADTVQVSRESHFDISGTTAGAPYRLVSTEGPDPSSFVAVKPDGTIIGPAVSVYGNAVSRLIRNGRRDAYAPAGWLARHFRLWRERQEARWWEAKPFRSINGGGDLLSQAPAFHATTNDGHHWIAYSDSGKALGDMEKLYPGLLEHERIRQAALADLARHLEGKGPITANDAEGVRLLRQVGFGVRTSPTPQSSRTLSQQPSEPPAFLPPPTMAPGRAWVDRPDMMEGSGDRISYVVGDGQCVTAKKGVVRLETTDPARLRQFSKAPAAQKRYGIVETRVDLIRKGGTFYPSQYQVGSFPKDAINTMDLAIMTKSDDMQAFIPQNTPPGTPGLNIEIHLAESAAHGPGGAHSHPR